MLDLNEMAIFHAIVAEGGISGASRKTGMPKSTLSRKLNLLEERLGVRLLNRTTRQIEVTELGQIYLSSCQKMLDAAEEAERAVAHRQNEPSGLLRITAPNSFGQSFIGQLMHDFINMYPKIEMDIVMTNDVLDLVSENIDAAIRLGPLRDSSLIARKWMPAPRILVSSADYLMRNGRPESVADLARFQTVTVKGIPWQFKSSPTFCDQDLSRRLTVNDMGFAHRMALTGAGMAILPVSLCFKELEEGRLVHLLPEEEVVSDSFYLVYPTRDQMPLKLRVFLDFFIAKSKRPPPWARYFSHEILPDET